MKLTTSALLSLLSVVSAQTFTTCNPLKQSCPPDPALGGHASFDFTKGGSNRFSSVGPISYDGNGASFTISKAGDAPTITSEFYIMFGHVDVVLKAAPGTGIVSSVVFESDCLDEIDWEWLGGNDAQVQSNYFRQGNTGAYDRAASHNAPGNHDGFHTYGLDWNSERIQWLIDGQVVRTLNNADARGQYPQTPMKIKVGSWAGGADGNAPGTIEWAGGHTNFGAGPFVMQVKSLDITDYSTGSEYTYSGSSGDWTTIHSTGGKVDGQGTPGSGPQVVSSAPAPDPTSSTPSSPEGLPSGWIVTDTGRAIAPSSAISTSPSASSSSASSSGSSSSGSESSPNATITSSPTGFSTTTSSGNGGASGTGASSPTVAPSNGANGNSAVRYGAMAIIGMVYSVLLL